MASMDPERVFLWGLVGDVPELASLVAAHLGASPGARATALLELIRASLDSQAFNADVARRVLAYLERGRKSGDPRVASLIAVAFDDVQTWT